ncbi:MAG: DNA adenine methylase, partial [Candidatus Cloacimonetes bacterium HGW-Cloacimonetes-1]
FLDAFAGSNVIGYFMKCQGKRVVTNDFMTFSYLISTAIIENSSVCVSDDELMFLLHNENDNDFIYETFRGLYFSDVDNRVLDRVRFNLSQLECEYKQALGISALVRACLKKRPRGIFTYTGQKYDDGRKDIKCSITEHFIESLSLFNNAVFDNGTNCKAENKQTFELDSCADMVYIDPPYYTPNSDNDYVRRYHFVEGLAKNWQGLDIQNETMTKKFKSYNSPFSSKASAYIAFDELIKKYKESIVVVSYSSNSLPTKNEMLEILSRYKNQVKFYEFDHTYSFGNQNHKIGNKFNHVKEYLFIGDD